MENSTFFAKVLRDCGDYHVMEGVRAHWETFPVEIGKLEASRWTDKELHGRLGIVARNEGGYCSTAIDLLDVIEWVKKNMPELLK